MKIMSIGCISIILFLGGCSDSVTVAEQKMQAIQQQPVPPIKNPPFPEQVAEFSYNTNQLRSPFMPPSLLVVANRTPQASRIIPDTKRMREPLEDYEMNQIILKGILVTASNQRYGLVQRPDGIIEKVKVGNYIGKNHGRIVKITPTQINIIEILPDGGVGYLEKPNTLTLPAG